MRAGRFRSDQSDGSAPAYAKRAKPRRCPAGGEGSTGETGWANGRRRQTIRKRALFQIDFFTAFGPKIYSEKFAALFQIVSRLRSVSLLRPPAGAPRPRSAICRKLPRPSLCWWWFRPVGAVVGVPRRPPRGGPCAAGGGPSGPRRGPVWALPASVALAGRRWPLGLVPVAAVPPSATPLRPPIGRAG